MCSRRLIFGLIILTLLATCLLTAAKLRATPKYDRVQVGKPLRQLLGNHAEFDLIDIHITVDGEREIIACEFDCYEGRVAVLAERVIADDENLYHSRLTAKRVNSRGPLDRLAWLAGWR